MTDQPTRQQMALTYDDGTTVVVAVRPYGIVAAERHFGADMPQIEGSLYAVWSQLRGAGDERAAVEFDAWVQSLDVIDAADTTDPTDAATAAD
jgi:hypothetical protein